MSMKAKILVSALLAIAMLVPGGLFLSANASVNQSLMGTPTHTCGFQNAASADTLGDPGDGEELFTLPTRLRAKLLAPACQALASLVPPCTSTANQPAGRVSPRPPRADPATITVLHAGMVRNLVNSGLVPAVKECDDVTLNATRGNSVALANGIKDGTLTGDLFMSADAAVNQTLMGASNSNWVDWFMVFARNEVVLAYSPNSQSTAQFEQARDGQIPWYEVLEQPGVTLGRDDPNLDPLGYYGVFVGQLAEQFYQLPGLKQRILGDDNNPEQVIAPTADQLKNGTLDAAFMYINRAKDDGVPFVRLPDQINLSNPDFTSEYATASYTTNLGQTFRGAPIQVSIAPLRNGNQQAAAETIELLTSARGSELLNSFGFLPSPILVGGNINAIPIQLMCRIEGTYTTP
ncbi:MAG: extracellular solute-binding protein [Pseudonocardiaceae bacterium]